jgi:hypothetical protein
MVAGRTGAEADGAGDFDFFAGDLDLHVSPSESELIKGWAANWLLQPASLRPIVKVDG